MKDRCMGDLSPKNIKEQRKFPKSIDKLVLKHGGEVQEGKPDFEVVVNNMRLLALGEPYISAEAMLAERSCYVPSENLPSFIRDLKKLEEQVDGQHDHITPKGTFKLLHHIGQTIEKEEGTITKVSITFQYFYGRTSNGRFLNLNDNGKSEFMRSFMR